MFLGSVERDQWNKLGVSRSELSVPFVRTSFKIQMKSDFKTIALF